MSVIRGLVLNRKPTSPWATKRQVSRRTLLRRGGTALAAAVASASAGCSGLPPLGSEVTFGAVDAPEPGETNYRQWLPAPSALPENSIHREGYGVSVARPGDVADSGLDVPGVFPLAFITGRSDCAAAGRGRRLTCRYFVPPVSTRKYVHF